MKNVLFATTALVAFAGAASAASHGGTPAFGWAGDVEVGYADSQNGFYVDGGFDLTMTTALDNGVTVEVTYGFDLYGAQTHSELIGDDFPTLVITTNLLTFTAGTVESAGADNYSAVDGMDGTTGFFEENGEFVVRLDASFGDIAVALSGVATNEQLGGGIGTLSLGASGTFGSVAFGVGYDDGGDAGVNVGVTFGSISVDLAYQAGGNESSIGIGLGATVGSIDLAAYYALNSAAASADAFGVSADATFGATTVGAYYKSKASGVTHYGVTAEMAVNDAITAGASYDSVDSYEVYLTMDIGNGAEVGAAYSDIAANGGDYDTGINVWFSAEF